MEIWSIIIDDEPHAIAELADIVSRVPGISVSGEFDNVSEAFDFVKEIGHIDVIFCDIQMPKMNGLAAAELLKAYCDHLIYVTAYQDHAFEAFSVHASAYLLKPVSTEAVVNTMIKVIQKRSRHSEQQSDELVFIKGGHKNSFSKLVLKEVYAIEAMANYVTIRSMDGEHVTYMGLKSVAEQLRKYENFYRISKSVIVNMDHVKTIDGHIIRMDNNQVYTVGETHRGAFHEFIRKRTLRP